MASPRGSQEGFAAEREQRRRWRSEGELRFSRQGHCEPSPLPAGGGASRLLQLLWDNGAIVSGPASQDGSCQNCRPAILAALSLAAWDAGPEVGWACLGSPFTHCLLQERKKGVWCMGAGVVRRLWRVCVTSVWLSHTPPPAWQDALLCRWGEWSRAEFCRGAGRKKRKGGGVGAGVSSTGSIILVGCWRDITPGRWQCGEEDGLG